MTTAPASPRATNALAGLLRGEEPTWHDVGLDAASLLELCTEEDLTGLVHQRLSALPGTDWPPSLSHDLETGARAEATREMVRRRELVAVLGLLATANVHPILFKGTPLAYLIYDSPSLRPRSDTDMLVRREETGRARAALEAHGYIAPPYCDGELLFCQFELQKTDRFGVRHALDLHWKISTQSLFADRLDWDELAASSVAVPALGPHARAPGPLHALLLACIHPVMHHRNSERLIWLYDIHLLASRLSPTGFDQFAALARTKGVSAICAAELSSARTRFGTVVPEAALAELASPGRAEPTARYLEPSRRWHDELLSSVSALGTWSSRLRLLREVAFPSPQYMLKSYRWPETVLGRALLPALYAHRGVTGVAKVLLGRK